MFSLLPSATAAIKRIRLCSATTTANVAHHPAAGGAGRGGGAQYSNKRVVGVGCIANGQIGQGQSSQTVLLPAPVRLFDALEVKKLVMGPNHSILILDNGAALSWGYNETGQLGQGHREISTRPRPVVGLDGHKVVDAACGPYQSFIVSQNISTGKQAIWHTGVPYWDSDPYNPFTTFTAAPKKIKKKIYLEKKRVKKIVAGAEHAVFLTEFENRLYTFGSSDEGTLGHATEYESSKDKISGPSLVPALKDVAVRDAVSGFGHILALTENQEVYAWGYNASGECGLDSGSKSIPSPRKIKFFTEENIKVKQLACGEFHSAALDEEGNVYTWGSHSDGKLGLGDLEGDVLVPRKIEFFAEHGKKVKFIACGTEHTVAITDSSDVYVWGNGSKGALTILTENKSAWVPIRLYVPQFEKLRKSMRKIPFIEELLIQHKEYDVKYLHVKPVPVEAYCGDHLTLLKYSLVCDRAVLEDEEGFNRMVKEGRWNREL